MANARTALITGITGQDGSYLAELLLAKGYRVVGMVRRSSSENYERIAHLVDRIQLSQADLLDQLSLVHVLQDARPNKRVYTITPAGRTALRAWLAEPWGLATLRDESLVKLTVADPLPDAEIVVHLRGLKVAHERRCAEFEAEIADLPDDVNRNLILALRKGVHAQRAFARWCQEAIDTLESGT